MTDYRDLMDELHHLGQAKSSQIRLSPGEKQQLQQAIWDRSPHVRARPRGHGWWVAVGTGFAAILAVGIGHWVIGLGHSSQATGEPSSPAIAMKHDRPILIDARPWDILIYPRLLDPGHYRVALRYDGNRTIAAPRLMFSWGRHHAHDLLPSTIGLNRSQFYTVAVIGNVTYSSTLIHEPLKILWMTGHTRHQTAVNLGRGRAVPVTDTFFYTGRTKKWRISYAAETIHVGNRTVPKAVIRLQYRGPGTFGKYVEYSLQAPSIRRFPTVDDTSSSPTTRVLRDQVPVVLGHPARMVLEVKWAGHRQRIVLKPQRGNR